MMCSSELSKRISSQFSTTESNARSSCDFGKCNPIYLGFGRESDIFLNSSHCFLKCVHLVLFIIFDGDGDKCEQLAEQLSLEFVFAVVDTCAAGEELEQQSGY